MQQHAHVGWQSLLPPSPRLLVHPQPLHEPSPAGGRHGAQRLAQAAALHIAAREEGLAASAARAAARGTAAAAAAGEQGLAEGRGLALGAPQRKVLAKNRVHLSLQWQYSDGTARAVKRSALQASRRAGRAALLRTGASQARLHLAAQAPSVGKQAADCRQGGDGEKG